MDSITINGVEYNHSREVEFLRELHKGGSPDWEIEIFQFVVDFLGAGATVPLQTSGSTGAPQVIHAAKAAMTASARRTLNHFGLRPGMRVLLSLPVSYVAGKMMLVRAIAGSLDVIAEKPSLTPNRQQGNYDFTAMTPMQLAGAAAEGLLNGIRTLIVGGGPLTHKALTALSGVKCEVIETYGMTETFTHIAVRTVTGGRVPDFFDALAGVSFRLDERGCLIIDDDITGVRGLVTNDVAELKGTRQFRLIGRYDNVINSDGIKIHPEQVECKIEHLFGNVRYYAAGIPHAERGQAVALFVEGDGGGVTIEQLRPLLPKYEVPVKIFYGSKIEETVSGKLIRKGN